MRIWFLLLFAIASSAVACKKASDPVPVPTPIAQPTITEEFSGTLLTFGHNLHTFEVKQPSEVDVTLKAVATVAVDANPDADPPVVAVPSMPVTLPLTIIVGQPSITTLGVTCGSYRTVTAPAGSSPQITGQAIPGTFCIAIADPNGTLSNAVTYTVTVAHS